MDPITSHPRLPYGYHEHDDGTNVNGHGHPFWDIPHDHGEVPEPPRAVPLSPEENMKIEAAEREAEQARLTAIRLQELKTTKWTVDDLKALLFDVGGKSGYAYLNGADIKNLHNLQLEAQKGILDKQY